MLILQGTDDPLVPYDGGEINALGAKPSRRNWPIKIPKDGCRAKKLTYPKGRDGTEVIWEFFKSHPKP